MTTLDLTPLLQEMQAMNQSFGQLRTQLDALLASNATLITSTDRVVAALTAARDLGADMTPAQLQDLLDSMAGQTEANDAARARADSAVSPATSPA